MNDDSLLNDLVQEWLSLDQNPETRSEILRLRELGEQEELKKRMLRRIDFGTAGLRAICGGGFALMNDLIVIQTSQGICEYVKQKTLDTDSRGIVIGYDHRHHSERWAKLAANVFVQRGVKVNLLMGFVHTPLVPFAVTKLRAACGIMITVIIARYVGSLTYKRTHLWRKEYNGLKVYWENAVQIISPHDEGIRQAISENLIPTSWSINIQSSLIHDRTEELRKAYLQQLHWFADTFGFVRNSGKQTLVNTSLHGVGHEFVKDAFEFLGLPEFKAVDEQKLPDPEFPTVKFPNPEESGAMDLAMKCGEINNAVYIMAQDPDADRFSAAERVHGGDWHIFSGDELGAIFANRILEMYKRKGKSFGRLAMISSIVSSRLLPQMALVEGFKYQDCLTGFKFIGNAALNLENTGHFDVLFGYEEAIGFMFGPYIRDKDGVAAAVMFAILVNQLKETGETAYSYLQNLYAKYGYFKTRNGYYNCPNSTVKSEIFDRLRHFIPNGARTYPSSMAGYEITAIRDYTVGYDSRMPPTKLPKSNDEMITFIVESEYVSISLTLRASGTEPKIKYYLEGKGRQLDKVLKVLPLVVDEISHDWVEMTKHNLVHSA